MDTSSAHVAVHPGDGLVGRFGDTVLLIGGPVSEEDPFVEELVATVEVGSAAGALPGAALAQRIGELLFRAGSAGVASFGVVTPVEGGALVLLHGDVDADIGQPSGGTRLSGRRAVTWVDHVVPTPFDRVTVTQGDSGLVAVHPRSDLRVGVVPGAGFVLTPAARAPVPAAPAVTPVGAEPDDELLPTEATEAATAMPDDELMAPATPMRETSAPFDQAEDITPPQAGRATVGAGSPGGDEDGPAGPVGRAAATMAPGGAPPELVGEDGSRTPLDGEYVLGREPSADEAVRSRQASPLQVDDPDQLVSRVHAHLWVDHGAVVVRDASSANGTFVAAPGAKDWTRVGQEGAELPVGWSMRVGGRIFTLEPGSPISRPSSPR
ncbi:MAG TPA: FHA domain-containing protein [Acidimicrobiales bacterium]|nr:FHA domain-containing protein [Acidimicrobiales bacterium]